MSTARGRVVQLQRERCHLQAAAFLAQPDLMPSSRRSYGQTMRPLVRDLGAGIDVAEIDRNGLEFVVRQAWGDVAPRTWNRHLAASSWWPRSRASRVDGQRVVETSAPTVTPDPQGTVIPVPVRNLGRWSSGRPHQGGRPLPGAGPFA